MMQRNLESDLSKIKCETINSLIDLIESRTNYRFDFDFKFKRPEAPNLGCQIRKAIKLSNGYIDDYLLQNQNLLDTFTLTRSLINLIKSFLLNNLTSHNEKQDQFENFERDSYLVELVEELDENEKIKPNVESKFVESMSQTLLSDSFNLIKKYDFYAENLVNEIMNGFGKEISDDSSNENEIEIKISLPSSISNFQAYLQRRHSADIASYNYKSDPTNPTLPNIVEDRLSEIDCFWRRHSLNTTSYKINKSFNNPMPVIIVDFEEEFDEKSSSRSSLDRSRLSDSESEISNNQFKQYTKVTLKNLLNKSPNRKKNTNEKLQSRNEDFFKENALQKSEFCREIVDDIVLESLKTIKLIINNNYLLAQNLIDNSLDKAFDETRKIFQIRKINNLYLKCDCVNMLQGRRKKERIDCKLLIYLIFCALEEIGFSNSVIFECKNFELMKKLNIQ